MSSLKSIDPSAIEAGNIVDVSLPTFHPCSVEAVHADGTITVRPVCCSFRATFAGNEDPWEYVATEIDMQRQPRLATT